MKAKVLEHSRRIDWDVGIISDFFAAPQELPSYTLKAAKALCFGLQLFVQDEEFGNNRRLQQVQSMRQFLVKHSQFTRDFSYQVERALERVEAQTDHAPI